MKHTWLQYDSEFYVLLSTCRSGRLMLVTAAVQFHGQVALALASRARAGVSRTGPPDAVASAPTVPKVHHAGVSTRMPNRHR